MVAIRLKHSSSARTRLPENDPPCSDWCKHLHMFYPAGERVAPPPAPFDSRISGGERSTAVVFRSADWRSGDSRLIGTMFQGVNEIVPRSCSSIPGIGNLDREAAAGIHPAKARYTELGWERINSLPLVVFLTHPLCVALRCWRLGKVDTENPLRPRSTAREVDRHARRWGYTRASCIKEDVSFHGRGQPLSDLDYSLHWRLAKFRELMYYS